MSYRQTAKSARALAGSVSAAALLAAVAAAPSQAIPYTDEVGDEGAQEFAQGYDGVVQIFLQDNATGGIFFNCTGSMINPRTVLSAAHCFNASDDGDYGLFGTQTPIIAFGEDTFTALDNYLLNGTQFVDDDNGLTFGTDLLVHPTSDGNNGIFPAADVAMIATLDPLYTVPTYGMLFSPIPEERFDEGVLVNQVGYGSFGEGSAPSVGIDGKRRAGENMLGFLGNFNAFFQGLGNNDDPGVDSDPDNQNMYWIDFDLPGREGECSRGDSQILPGFGFDDSITCTDWDGVSGNIVDGDTIVEPGPSFDVFPGDALDNEVGTDGGDSGGPLFAVDLLEDMPLILGVLSGGFVDGFYHAAGQQYGSVSYYNPTFAYANWIAENNPYKYVSTVEGDGDWSDESRWVQNIDPNYFVYDENGEIVNGLPEGEDEETSGETPPLGTVFDVNFGSEDEPVDGGGGDDQDPPAEPEAGRDGVASAIGGGLAATLGGGVDHDGRDADGQAETGGSTEASGGMTTTDDAAQPISPAVAGPGSTGFVPNNEYGFLGDPAAFFDVTLSADGTTTLDLNVEIDRLSIAGEGAALDIGEDFAMTSLIGTEVFAGNLNVDGLLSTREVTMWGGVLSGTGTLELLDFNYLFGNGELVTGTLYNVAGAVDPAGAGEIGEFLILGDYVQTEAGMLLIDWDGETADVLNVDGDVSLDGVVGVTPAEGYVPQDGDRRRILLHSGERVGEFAGASALPGVLFFEAIYGAGFVDLEVEAGDFVGFADYGNPGQEAIAARFDAARGQDTGLDPLYSSIDLLAPADLTVAFENLMPHEGFQFQRAANSHTDALGGALRQRVLHTDPSQRGSSGAAMFSLMSSEQGQSMSGESLAMAARQAGEGGPDVTDAGNGVEVFLTGGLLDGKGQTSTASPAADMEGAYALGGADYSVTPQVRLGGAVGFATTDTDQNLNGGGQASGRTETVQGSIYATYENEGLIGQLAASYGDHSASVRRTAAVAGGAYAVTGDLEASTMEASALVAYVMESGALRITPMGSFTWTETEYDESVEQGSLAALAFAEDTQTQQILRAGADFGYRVEAVNGVFEPTAYIGYAYPTRESEDAVVGDFVAAPGSQPIAFGSGLEPEDGWFELSVGVIGRLPNGLEVFGTYSAREGDDLLRDTRMMSLGVRLDF